MAITEPENPYRLSAIGQLQAQLDRSADARLRTVPERHVKAVILWLEAQQLHVTMEAVIEDDALRSAKLRGRVEGIVELVERLLAELEGRKAAPPAQPAERLMEDDDE